VTSACPPNPSLSPALSCLRSSPSSRLVPIFTAEDKRIASILIGRHHKRGLLEEPVGRVHTALVEDGPLQAWTMGRNTVHRIDSSFRTFPWFLFVRSISPRDRIRLRIPFSLFPLFSTPDRLDDKPNYRAVVHLSGLAPFLSLLFRDSSIKTLLTPFTVFLSCVLCFSGSRPRFFIPTSGLTS